jgi:hypothetical protein
MFQILVRERLKEGKLSLILADYFLGVGMSGGTDHHLKETAKPTMTPLNPPFLYLKGQ